MSANSAASSIRWKSRQESIASRLSCRANRTFETEINLLAGQKSEVKDRARDKGSIEQNDAMIKQIAQQGASNPR